MSNPALAGEDRARLVHDLMASRRLAASSRRANDRRAEEKAHVAINRAKVALGERGPVWWDDGAQDYNRYLVHNTPYAAWFASLEF